MVSKYQEGLRELALEADSDKRLEMAASLDSDIEELNENWDTRDEFKAVLAQKEEAEKARDKAISERDEWKTRYADRFFEVPQQQAETTKTGVKREDVVLNADDLWR